MVNQARRFLTFVICLAVLGGAAPAARAVPPAADPIGDLAAPPVGPGPDPAPEQRCTEDRAYCIRLASYIPDVCRTIEAVARANSLDQNFFARLLWRESLFEAGAVSPAGAQGIAQFMPETARLRGLDDAFNPAEALSASARYLAELARDYGNIGLAAAAYNGGEARVARFIAAKGGLAPETRAYVHAITGYSVEAWRDAPPETLDLSLAKEAAFQAACIAHAANRSLREFRDSPPVLPWGAIVASNRERDGAQRQVTRLQNRYAEILRGEPVSYSRGRMPGMARSLNYAQIGRNSRAEAEALCDRLRAAGGDCMVQRN